MNNNKVIYSFCISHSKEEIIFLVNEETKKGDIFRITKKYLFDIFNSEDSDDFEQTKSLDNSFGNINSDLPDNISTETTNNILSEGVFNTVDEKSDVSKVEIIFKKSLNLSTDPNDDILVFEFLENANPKDIFIIPKTLILSI